MRVNRWLRLASSLLVCGAIHSNVALAQEAEGQAPCREQPCAVIVDWARAGGVANQVSDRRYGNPVRLEELLKADLTELGYALHGSADDQNLRIVLVPVIRNARCDQLPGTTTDMSCRAIVEVQTRIEGPSGVTESVDLPSRLRNRCPGDEVMTVDKLAAFVATWIVYAVEGRAKGDRRPLARC